MTSDSVDSCEFEKLFDVLASAQSKRQQQQQFHTFEYISTPNSFSLQKLQNVIQHFVMDFLCVFLDLYGHWVLLAGQGAHHGHLFE